MPEQNVLKPRHPTPQPAPVYVRPEASDGLEIYRNLDLDETGVLVEAGDHLLYGYYVYNAATSARYVKFYDKATAPSIADTPLMTCSVPAGSGANLASANGISFALGIGLRATTGVADNNVGAPAANDVVINLWYV